jgi:ubiquinone/menaquinone biosynthesis C-methylase UbiE
MRTLRRVPDEIRHPVFARLFDRLSRSMESEEGPRRDQLLAGLTGRVLEIGAGNGIGFAHYPASVGEVVAIEPEPYLRAKAERAAQSAPVPVSVHAGVAEHLDQPDGSFDAVVACQVLCTVRDQAGALRELRRVLGADGELRFFEHVLAPSPGKARLQALADGSRIWPLIGGGCHCARNTPGAIEAAGFRITQIERFDVGPSWTHTNPHVLGWAVR